MSEIPKVYEPAAVEEKWYAFWLAHGCFAADPASRKPPYSIVIPPPNVTGVLHMGHVLNNTIQDLLSRKARMDGKEVLWLPGTDHAGIATEGIVARQIRREEKKSKSELGREEFLKRVWAWKEKHGNIIIEQLKKLGCSCDWSRQRFTMDEDYVRCVQKVFVDLHQKGLIYRGKRMVNWCPATLTALSDEEVVMKEQKGSLYYFRVEVVNHPLGSSLSPIPEGRPGENSPRPFANEAVGPAAQPPFGHPPHGPDPSPYPLPIGGGEGVRRTGEGTLEGTPASPNPSQVLGAGKAQSFGPVIDAEGRMWLTIATTRPETIPGDTAVAVNPKDPRYAHLIGAQILRPLPAELPREQKLVPIVGDEHVDFEFGTGVLKVTPAHDPADFDIGQRHQLPVVDIMNPDGTMNDLAGADLKGLERFKARKVAVEKLTGLGALEKEEPYTNKVGFSDRADVPIEPRLSEQWFLKYPCVDRALAAVVGSGSVPHADPDSSPASSTPGRGAFGGTPNGAGETAALPPMRFHPERWTKTYTHWMQNIRDWCISRQLWWGHRIPVWYRKSEIRNSKSEVSKPEVWCDVDPPPDPENWEQDPDVLDTWFSSWLWPFATMGWTGDKTRDSANATLRTFYPTTDLVTAPEIIFFWVARMIMAGFEYLGEMPFRNVYFTGIIRDKQGRKMSKSLGNSPDPLDLIAQYGADAVRFGTMRSAPLGQDVMFDEKDVELGRNFCNKLWNACRFRQMQSGETEREIDPALLTSDDKWILLKLDKAIREIDDAFAGYRFNEVTQTLYRLFWSEYCDWYVEASKAVLTNAERGMQNAELETPRGGDGLSGTQSAIRNPQSAIEAARRENTLAVMDFVLGHMLRLFHPFLPFITEELWQGMGFHRDLLAGQGGDTIMFAHWPKPLDADFKAHYGLDESDERLVDAKYDLVGRGRNLRREFNLPANKKARFVFKPTGEPRAHDLAVIRLLLNAETVEVNPAYTPPKGTPSAFTALGELFMPLEGLVDVAAERARLGKEIARLNADITKVEAKLNNPGFVAKAPPQVLEESRAQLAELTAKRQRLQAALDALGGA